MYHIALLTSQDFPVLTVSDRKLIPELLTLGNMAEAVVWDEPDVNWINYDALIFRSTWDYFTKQDVFFVWIEDLKRKNIITFNPLVVIKKNAHKFYLQEMESSGIKIIPSVFIPRSENIDIDTLIPYEWKKVVIKPAVSAGSYLTELFDRSESDFVSDRYTKIIKDHDMIIQKFIPEIQTPGEISMVFFDKKFSHSVIKTPKAGDFRIQSQFGGQYVSYTPSDLLVKIGTQIVESVKEDLLYARVDGVLIHDEFHLMELELIEPDLYMDYLPDGQNTFSKVIKEYLDNRLKT